MIISFLICLVGALGLIAVALNNTKNRHERMVLVVGVAIGMYVMGAIVLSMPPACKPEQLYKPKVML